MGIFGNMMDKIRGKYARSQEAKTNTAVAANAPAGGYTIPAPAPGAAPLSNVDIEALLEGLAAESKGESNWRYSIVDLMKLLDMDNSLAERKELAKELGYTGSTDDSAAMNTWLHKEVVRKLAENGGKVPANMLD